VNVGPDHAIQIAGCVTSERPKTAKEAFKRLEKGIGPDFVAAAVTSENMYDHVQVRPSLADGAFRLVQF
jgi:hypothetical protein